MSEGRWDLKIVSRAQRHKAKKWIKHAIAESRILTLPFEAALWSRAMQQRALPGALVIGGHKCGSTSLYSYLLQHPQVSGVFSYPSYEQKSWVDKEVFYFSLEEYKFKQRGLRWYQAHFDQPKKGVINLEATPTYLTDQKVPARVHSVLPNAKMIASLRDPVARAFSAYHHLQRVWPTKDSFRDRIEAELQRKRDSSVDSEWSLLEMGKYAESLERWFALFPREQFHIIDFRDLTKHPSETVARVLAFLGLPPAPINTERVHMQGRYSERMEPDLEERLREYYEPHNRRLEALLGYSMGW